MTSSKPTKCVAVPSPSKPKEQAARAHLKAWKESKLSVMNYCKLNTLSESTFYGWKKRYSSGDKKGFAPVSPRPHDVRVNAHAVEGQSISINLPQGIILHVDNVTNVAHVTQLIKALTSWN